MSFRIVALLVLVFVCARANGQVSLTNTVTGTVTGTLTGTNSVTGSSSGSITGSATNTVTNTGTPSNTITQTISPTGTFPRPPTPTNLINYCLRPDGTPHITYFCLGWSDASGTSTSFALTYTPSGGTAVTLTTKQSCVNGGCYLFIGNLAPGTSYAISIVGYDNAGRFSLPLTSTIKTDPLDAKTDFKNLDLKNVACVYSVSATTYRTIITCTWGLPTIAPGKIEVKARCRPNAPNVPHQRNKTIHKLLTGTSTTYILPISRYNSKCVVEINGYYTNHYRFNGRGHVFKILVNVP